MEAVKFNFEPKFVLSYLDKWIKAKEKDNNKAELALLADIRTLSRLGAERLQKAEEK